MDVGICQRTGIWVATTGNARYPPKITLRIIQVSTINNQLKQLTINPGTNNLFFSYHIHPARILAKPNAVTPNPTKLSFIVIPTEVKLAMISNRRRIEYLSSLTLSYNSISCPARTKLITKIHTSGSKELIKFILNTKGANIKAKYKFFNSGRLWL